MNLSKHVLYITFDGLSDPLGQSQILPYLIGLSKNGYHIHIISCEKKDRYHKEKVRIHELISGLPIQWKHIFYDENGSSLSRLMYIRKLKRIANQIRKEKQLSLVHCRSYLSSLIGLEFKLKYKIPFVFDMRGLWADERIDGGIWNLQKPLHKFFYQYFKRKEKQFVTHADAIVSLTNSGVSELSKLYGTEIVKPKTTVIPCCTNVKLFDKNSITKKLLITGINDNDHVFIYTGSIGTWYYTKELIDCMVVWKEKIKNLKLLIITRDTDELGKILSQYSKQVNEFVVTASASYQQVPSYLALAKAAVFFIKPAYSKIASSPTKMAECWAMGLPIITNAGIGDNDLYFNQYNGGVLINEFSNLEYEKSCSEYLEFCSRQMNVRQLALDYFDNQDAVKKYTTIYQKHCI